MATRGSGWNDSVLMAHAWRAARSGDGRQAVDTDEQTVSARSQQPSDSMASQLQSLNELSLALQVGAERYRETTQLAAAFLDAARAWQPETTSLWPATQASPASARERIDEDSAEQIAQHTEGSRAEHVGKRPALALPVVCGWLGAVHGIPLQMLLAGTLQATSSNLAWIATRLVPLGQSDCLKIIASLESVVEDVALRACDATLQELGSATLAADLASLQHEQLPGRVCLT